MASGYDAVVIGAGHNGLTCAAYLARAGLKVLAIEQYRTVGGMTISEEITGQGRLSDIHASGFLLGKLSPAPDELGLSGFGLETITPDPNWVSVFSDGTSVSIGRAMDDTLRSLARLSANDAAAWQALYDRYFARRDGIMRALNQPPTPLAEEVAGWSKTPRGLESFRDELQSVRSWCEQHFEADATKAFFSSFACHGDMSPDDAGGGGFVWLFCSSVQDVGCSTVKGGMASRFQSPRSRARGRGRRDPDRCPGPRDRVRERESGGPAARSR